jgi:hypothetical protein
MVEFVVCTALCELVERVSCVEREKIRSRVSIYPRGGGVASTTRIAR